MSRRAARGQTPHPGIEDVQRQYAREAPAYEERWREYLGATLPPTLEALAPRAGERLLDAGCGTGLLLRRIGAEAPETERWGIDLSSKMLRLAREHDAGRLAIADVHRLPFRSGSFHAVVSSSSLHHWSRPETALLEIRRVLRRGGRVVLTDWADDHLPTRLLGFLLRFTDRSHRRTLGSRAAVRLLEGAGFEVRSRRLFRSGWKWGFMTISAVLPSGDR
jgi:SAM-dependent methyltransferase